MTDAVIVSTARTGLGKSWKGAFNMTYGATLGAHSVRHAVERAGIDPAEVEDVIMGSTFGEGTTGGNIARAIALRAGLPVTTGGLSINRFCSSGLQSIALAAQRILTEGASVIVAGGVESISCVQNEANTHMRKDPWLAEHNPTLYWVLRQSHTVLAYFFFLIFIAHFGAILFHTLIVRDGMLKRMVPWNVRPPSENLSTSPPERRRA